MREDIFPVSILLMIATILLIGCLPFSVCMAKEGNMELIKIDSGYISGTVNGEVGNEVHVYRGIPYAAPPVGKLRWKAPQPAASWPGILECVAFKSAPVQEGGPMAYLEQSEDCLYLNIMTPAKEPSEKLPVMVWFHGGGLSFCTANDPLFNGYRLPQKGVIIVTVSHRLGTLGLMAHPLLSNESEKGVSGNYLFLDLIESLKWVKRNIAAFGGDPNNVTIFGESGGGAKVTAMLVSPLAKGLFNRAIIESGGGLKGTPLKEMEGRGEKLFAKLGVTKLEEARALSYDKIVEAGQALQEESNTASMGGAWDGAIDGWFLKDNAINLFKTGDFNYVPIIAGANLGELPNMGKAMDLISYYIDLFSATNKAGSKAYAYIFDQVPAGWKAQNGVSVHSLELFYVFGDYDYYTRPSWPLAQSLQPKSVTSEDPGLDATDKKVSNEMMEMWAQFAKTGNPSVNGLIKWPEYNSGSDQYIFIADPLAVIAGFSKVGN